MIHFKSESNEHYTPLEVLSKSHGFLGWIDLDPCADPGKRVLAQSHFTQEHNGLQREWYGKVWMNPPYGRTIGHWIRKAYEESLRGNLVVCLVPARTDTAWWHDYASKGHIEFIRGRLKFGGHSNPAPFPSAIVVFPKGGVL